MSERVTLSIRRLPIAGEMWIRCIDSQFWRYERRAPSIARRSRSSLVTSSTCADLGRLRQALERGFDESPQPAFRLGARDAVLLAALAAIFC
jgi:hypothetical protein